RAVPAGETMEQQGPDGQVIAVPAPVVIIDPADPGYGTALFRPETDLDEVHIVMPQRALREGAFRPAQRQAALAHLNEHLNNAAQRQAHAEAQAIEMMKRESIARQAGQERLTALSAVLDTDTNTKSNPA